MIFIYLIVLLSFLHCFAAVAQKPLKKHITEADYDKWGTLYTKSLSASGKWVSYEMDYENKQDTLFVQNTNGRKIYTIPAGKEGRFGTDTYFACITPGAHLQLLDLSSGAIKVISNVMAYQLTAQGKYIISLGKRLKQKQTLKIYDHKAKLLDSIEGVTEYKLNDQADAMVFVANGNGRYGIGWINFQKYEKQLLLQNSLTRFHRLVWQKNGRSFAYLTETDSAAKIQVANYYNLEKRVIYKLDKFVNGTKLITSRIPMVISEDGKFVTVGLSNRPTVLDKNALEIWNGNDKSIFPQVQAMNSHGGPITLVRWSPEIGVYKQISSDSLPKTMINKSISHALISNENAYANNLPSYYPKTDYYLKSIQSGKEQLFLKCQSTDPNQVIFSPKGDKILYYDEKNWWIYDLLLEKRLNLTQKIAVTWSNCLADNDVPSQLGVYGMAWINDEKNVLLYDEFDLWLVAIDGTSYTRLTKGREKQKVFRIANTEFQDRDGKYLGNVDLDLSKGILLKIISKNDWSSGFAFYRNGEGVQSIVYGQRMFDEINRTSTGYIFTSQAFDVSPQLLFKAEDDTKSIVLYQSNKHQEDFVYGRSELIRYQNMNGDSLKAAIFYPAGFDASKKYPMVVHPYEIQSKTIHIYENPSLLNSIGFNISNYTANGYIVLLPDIKFKLGAPAITATQSIISGVQAVINMGIVLTNKIGLIGHSFGGYETNYVISQTGLFAAAVSGAGLSDVIGSYFNLNENHSSLPDMWRYESQQQRMGKSLYEDKEGYLRNSPIMSADKIETPLLIWSGKRDRVVPVVQSVTMYLALRRLEKQTIFLAYPNENHTLGSPSNQIDLSKRISNWFDYYLKGEKPANWITTGIGTGK